MAPLNKLVVGIGLVFIMIPRNAKVLELIMTVSEQ